MQIRDHNWRKGGYEVLTYRKALLNKSRIGMYHVMMTLPDGMDYWKYATDQTKNKRPASSGKQGGIGLKAGGLVAEPYGCRI